MSVAQAERAELVSAMRAVGPDHPTLCGDWTTRDLAAHLLVRERRLDAAPGIFISKFAGYTERVQDQVAVESDWDVLLDKVASGPPTLSPFKLLDPLVNVSEMFIHHEDVLRAKDDWAPRDLDDATTTAVAKQVPIMARMAMSKPPARVTLRTTAGKTLTTIGSGAPVIVTGDPAELLLFVSGRDQIQVDITGDDEAVRAVREGRGGV